MWLPDFYYFIIYMKLYIIFALCDMSVQTLPNLYNCIIILFNLLK